MNWSDYLSTWTGGGEAVKDAKKVKTVLKEASNLLQKARYNGLIEEAVPGFCKETERVSKYLKGISDSIDKGESIYRAYEDAMKIKAAMETLSKGNGKILRYNPEGAASTFGLLFQGLGGWCKHLPAPADAYAKPLMEIGANFLKIYQMLDPHCRPGWGEQLRECNIQIGAVKRW